jgi:hypothetical protein
MKPLAERTDTDIALIRDLLKSGPFFKRLFFKVCLAHLSSLLHGIPPLLVTCSCVL